MDKPIILTQCYCRADILQFSFKNLYEHLQNDLEHWVLLKKYPINEAENEEKIKEYAKQYGCKIHDCGGDIGAHNGLNHFFDAHPEYIERRYIGFDPDTLVQSKGFDQALIDVMNAEPGIALLALSNAGMHPDCAFTAHDVIRKKYEHLLIYKKEIAGHGVIIHPAIDMANCCMIDSKWVMSLEKRFWEPFKYYGGLEHYLFDQMRRAGKVFAYLTDYMEAYDGNMENYKDKEYQQWKQDHLLGYSGSFKEWLIAKGKGDLL